jgi:hypothetical protein
MRVTSDVDSRETIVVGASVAAVVLAAIYWISRIGFTNPVAPIMEVLGLSLFLVATPLWLSRLRKTDEAADWWGSQSFLGIACIAVTIAAGVLARQAGLNGILLFAVTGFALAILTLGRWITRGRLVVSIAFLVGVVVFTVWCAGVVWGSRYKMPLFWETFAYRANIHHDTFYYTSMANMLDTYGVPSTGLDGIPIIRYHYGSPWIYGLWSHLIGTDPLSFYSLGYPIVMLPLFFSSVLSFSVELRAAFGLADSTRLRSDWRVWLVFLAATVGFIPTGALDALAVWNSNAFISESYTFAMSVMLLFFGVALRFWRSDRGRNGESFSSGAFLIVLLPLFLGILGFLKLSQMMIALGLAVYLFVRLKLYTRPLVFASIVLAAILTSITYHFVSLSDQNGGISPLDFMRFNSTQGWQQFFPLIHLLWTWVYVGARVWEERIRDFRGLAEAMASGRLIDVEVLLVFALLAFLPGEIVSIHGGSGVYFSDAQRWLALAFVVARAGVWVNQWRASRTAVRPAGVETRQGWRGVRLSVLLAVFVAAPFAITLVVNLAYWPSRVARANLALRRDLAAGTSMYLPIVTALREISRLPVAERRRSLLFIPQSSGQYWSMFTSDGRCSYTPLIAPAVASVAMLDGMPAFGCEVTNQYNMSRYKNRTHAQTEADVTDAALCSGARAKGFSEVIVLEAPVGSPPRRRRVDC